jgi:branched-chain amino acid aminotransferase
VLTRPGHVWVDGRLVPASESHIRVDDRGFQLGDGLFETLRARRGVPIEWDEHLARLADGAWVLAIRPPDADTLRAGLAELLDAEQLSGPGDDRGAVGDAAVRITISRGSLEGRGTLPAGWETARPTAVIQAWVHVPPPDALLARGVRAIVASVRHDPSSPLAGIKATSRADHVHAKLEAERAGVDDALFLTTDGRVSETTSANVFVVRGGLAWTPPRTAAVLEGATRSWLLSAAAVRGLELEPSERDLTLDDVVGSDEAFLSSSVAGIVPLVEVDGHPIGDGQPGPRTVALRAAREDWVDRASLAGLAALRR